MEPTSLSKDLYDEIILDGSYTDNIDKPFKYLGFEIGERVASPYQISNAIIAVSYTHLTLPTNREV